MVCVIVPEGDLPEWDRGLALRAVALGRAWTAAKRPTRQAHAVLGALDK